MNIKTFPFCIIQSFIATSLSYKTYLLPTFLATYYLLASFMQLSTFPTHLHYN